MRLAILVLFLVSAGCQRGEPTERQPVQPARTSVVEPTPVAVAPAAAAAEDSCGGMCGGACGGGGSCGGSCGGGCGGHGATKVSPATAIPSDAVWTDLDVRGMHCGGCARKIQRALATVDGVYGCEVDLGTATVRVASAPGKDGRALASPAIAALGFQVAK